MTKISNREIIATETADIGEIKQFLSCISFSPPEAMWEYKMHGQSHTFHSLAVPLPGGQHVHYQEFQEVQAQCCDLHLTAWFKLN